jgi:hypothetical protein
MEWANSESMTIMTLNKKLACQLLLATYCLSLTGCGTTQTNIEPLVGHYEEVTYTHSFFSEPQAHQITLQYKDLKGGRIMIWPSVRGPVIQNDVAVFVGGKAYEPPYPGEPKATKSRLFVVKAPGLPMDITDQVLALGAKDRGKSFSQIPKSGTIATLERTNDGIDVGIAFVDWTDRDIKLSWNQISDIMREMKENGVVRKDRVWGTSYIEKEFKPEVQK